MRPAARDGTALTTRTGQLVAAFSASVVLGRGELAFDDDAALAALAHSLPLVKQDRVVDPWRRPYLAEAIEALVRFGGLDPADRPTAVLEERAHLQSAVVSRPSGIVAAARCRALIAAIGAMPRPRSAALIRSCREPAGANATRARRA